MNEQSNTEVHIFTDQSISCNLSWPSFSQFCTVHHKQRLLLETATYCWQQKAFSVVSLTSSVHVSSASAVVSQCQSVVSADETGTRFFLHNIYTNTATGQIWVQRHKCTTTNSAIYQKWPKILLQSLQP